MEISQSPTPPFDKKTDNLFKMKIKNQVNSTRRSVMKSLTKNIGKSRYDQHIPERSSIKRILISRPNHRLGNLLLLTPLVQEVMETFPESKIDLFVKGNLAPCIFSNYKKVDRIIQLPKKPFGNILRYLYVWFLLRNRRYDMVINANQGSSSGKLSTLFANSYYKFFGEFNAVLELKHTDYHHIAKQPVYNFRNYSKELGLAENQGTIPLLDLKLNSNEIKYGGKKLNKIIRNNKKTICLFTNATGEKCYSEAWWRSFYEELKKEFTAYNIIEILPAENTSKLGFKIPTFYSLNIREIASVIANTSVFIGADSGIMHLASASQTPTVGLFSVTQENTYEPYNKDSLAINTNKVSNFEIIYLISHLLSKNTAEKYTI